jgi:ABC-2 type transport system ATP-binding protein
MTRDGDALGIEAMGLTRRFGEGNVVDHLDLRVPTGEFYGFLGANGAGKSTTIKMLCGYLPPSEGAVRVAGYDVAREPLAVKRVIGVMPEEPALHEKLTGGEFLEFAGRMHGLTQREAVRRAADLMELLELTGARHRLIGDYSMGMRKKTALAAALIHRPRVLFLDEPFNGMDTLSVRVVGDLLRRLTAGGATVFFSSHALETVERLCTRVGVLVRGRLVAEGTVAEVGAQSAVGADASLEAAFLALSDVQERKEALDWL